MHAAEMSGMVPFEKPGGTLTDSDPFMRMELERDHLEVLDRIIKYIYHRVARELKK